MSNRTGLEFTTENLEAFVRMFLQYSDIYLRSGSCTDKQKLADDFSEFMNKHYYNSMLGKSILWFDSFLERDEYLKTNYESKNRGVTNMNSQSPFSDIFTHRTKVCRTNVPYFIDRAGLALEYHRIVPDTILDLMTASNVGLLTNIVKDTYIIARNPEIQDAFVRYVNVCGENYSSIIMGVKEVNKNIVLRNISYEAVGFGITMILRLTASRFALEYYLDKIDISNNDMLQYARRVLEVRREFLRLFAFKILSLEQFRSVILVVNKPPFWEYV